jgi:phage tail protein X
MDVTITEQDDTVDLISLRVYGATYMVEKILEENHGLAAYGPLLPMGVRINLPKKSDQSVSTKTIKLWE